MCWDNQYCVWPVKDLCGGFHRCLPFIHPTIGYSVIGFWPGVTWLFLYWCWVPSLVVSVWTGEIAEISVCTNLFKQYSLKAAASSLQSSVCAGPVNMGFLLCSQHPLTHIHDTSDRIHHHHCIRITWKFLHLLSLWIVFLTFFSDQLLYVTWS